MVISGIKKFISDKNFQKKFMERGGRGGGSKRLFGIFPKNHPKEKQEVWRVNLTKKKCEDQKRFLGPIMKN